MKTMLLKRIYMIAFEGKEKVVRSLIDYHGVDVDAAKPNGVTSLWVAAQVINNN
jgi:hypothetical protein